MNTVVRAGAALAAILIVAAVGHAGTAASAVKRQGFCVIRSDTGCTEVALPGTMIDLARLPKAADGTRLIYFYSTQTLPADAILIHVLEAEDADPEVDTVVSEALQAKAAGLKTTLKKLAAKFGFKGAAVLTPFRIESKDNAPSTVFSQIAVHSPGVFYGSVVDAKGALIPASERISLNVIQGPR